jgi:hypothetical protein
MSPPVIALTPIARLRMHGLSRLLSLTSGHILESLLECHGLPLLATCTVALKAVTAAMIVK